MKQLAAAQHVRVSQSNVLPSEVKKANLLLLYSQHCLHFCLATSPFYSKVEKMASRRKMLSKKDLALQHTYASFACTNNLVSD